ncbi:MAG: class I SAM-dependent rRNA methyltransferase [Sandaracinaceae bacterium]
MARITLRSGRVQPVWAGHPWVFAQAIERIDGAPAPGDAVDVLDPRGNFLGRGFWSRSSAIPVRIIVRDPDEALDERALVKRIEAARERRTRIGLPDDRTDAYRLIHGEGDDLPGLVVDVYRDAAAVQITTQGMKRHEDAVFAAVARVTGARSVLEVPAAASQKTEGLAAARRVVRGPDIEQLKFQENGFRFSIDASGTQKTGYYVDQRDNRALVEKLARGRRALDLYSYVGSFALAAARGGAVSVESYDSSASAIAQGASIAAVNGFADKIRLAHGDARRVLSRLQQSKARFDLAIVDPPKLAPSIRHLRRAKSAYRKLNAMVFGLMERGGIVVSCSCSAALRGEELLRILSLSARDARREVRLLWMGQQGMDHPVPAAFPEGRYLKAAFVEIG